MPVAHSTATGPRPIVLADSNPPCPLDRSRVWMRARSRSSPRADSERNPAAARPPLHSCSGPAKSFRSFRDSHTLFRRARAAPRRHQSPTTEKSTASLASCLQRLWPHVHSFVSIASPRAQLLDRTRRLFRDALWPILAPTLAAAGGGGGGGGSGGGGGYLLLLKRPPPPWGRSVGRSRARARCART